MNFKSNQYKIKQCLTAGRGYFPAANSAGQTLIETVAAIFILVMGITAAIGLAIYAFASSQSVTKQIIATGLAREGIEAARNMRDTNWLQQTTIDTNCYDFTSNPVGLSTAKCYKQWDVSPYCLNPTRNNGNCNGNGDTTDSYNLAFTAANGGTSYWTLSKQNSVNYGLNFDSTGANGFYIPSNSANGNSDYYRKIILTEITTPPFDKSDLGAKLLVQSQVWWTDKKCPRSIDYPGAGKCSVELDSYLTNWKNY